VLALIEHRLSNVEAHLSSKALLVNHFGLGGIEMAPVGPIQGKAVAAVKGQELAELVVACLLPNLTMGHVWKTFTCFRCATHTLPEVAAGKRAPQQEILACCRGRMPSDVDEHLIGKSCHYYFVRVAAGASSHSICQLADQLDKRADDGPLVLHKRHAPRIGTGTAIA
jgi:hypothetical protein